MAELTIALLEVGEARRRFRLEAGPSWWQDNRGILRDPESGLARPLLLELEGYRLGERLFFRGTLSGAVELACGRCLEPYVYELSERIELLLEPLPRSSEPPEGGIELDPEDLEIARYRGDELDFGVVLRELLLFNWPVQPRCAEGCLGLCPSCGANRNLEPCRCAGDVKTRPFAGLGAMLEGKRRGTS
jgi:uncharacterized protein